MRPRLSRRAALTLSLAVMAVLAVALPAGASAARVLYAGGFDESHPIDVNRLAKFGGNTVVDPGNGHSLQEGFDGCSDSEWASALARTDFDVLIVGESAPRCGTPLSATTLTNIANWVSSGHRYLQTGAHGSEADFMNAVFGFGTTSDESDGSLNLTSTLQPSAAGTFFQGGPSTLTSLSLTVILGSTPGTTIYSSAEGTWVFTVPFGSGNVTFVGWDLCGEPDECDNNAPAAEDGWYQVLDSAMQPNNKFTVDGVARNKKKGNATITVTVPNPGELVASGNGVQAASAGAVISKAVGAGQATLVIRATGKKKKKLKTKGKTKLGVAITYTPTSGRATSQSLTVKLKKKHKKK
jgi:hypothetical protein